MFAWNEQNISWKAFGGPKNTFHPQHKSHMLLQQCNSLFLLFFALEGQLPERGVAATAKRIPAFIQDGRAATKSHRLCLASRSWQPIGSGLMRQHYFHFQSYSFYAVLILEEGRMQYEHEWRHLVEIMRFCWQTLENLLGTMYIMSVRYVRALVCPTSASYSLNYKPVAWVNTKAFSSYRSQGVALDSATCQGILAAAFGSSSLTLKR